MKSLLFLTMLLNGFSALAENVRYICRAYPIEKEIFQATFNENDRVLTFFDIYDTFFGKKTFTLTYFADAPMYGNLATQSHNPSV